MLPLNTPISMPLWFIYSLGFILFLLFIVIYWLTRSLIINRFTDHIIFLDKNQRWKLIYDKISGKETYSYKNKTYHLNPDAGLLNVKGKALYLFTENVPTPLKFAKAKTEWLDSESLDGVIKNKIVQQIVKPTDKFMDMLMMFGAIGGILACIASGIVLLITLGILKPPG